MIYDIEMAYYNQSRDPKDKPPKILSDMMKRGKLGDENRQRLLQVSGPEFPCQEGSILLILEVS